MKILFLASEVFPYSKTGGLGDVAGALPAALARLGHEVLVATPLYGSVDAKELEPTGKTLPLRFPFGREVARFRIHAPRPNLRVLFVESDRFFARPGIYGGPAGEYEDNHLRFGFFSMAALSGAMLMDFLPDVVHLNDWQTGIAAVALGRGYGGTALGQARSIFTIHNLAYQGVFPKRAMTELGLPWELFTSDGLEFYDQLNFMKAGLTYSDVLTTVSRRYAEEIQTPEAGWGLDGLLRDRAKSLFGILNGVDVEEWNPSDDPHLPAGFDADDTSGKRLCRARLLEHYGLSAPDSAPVYGIVSRFATQKGFDILFPALPALLAEEVRLVVLGSGDPRYVDGFRALAAQFPGKLGLQVGYDVALSHLVEAGSDFFLMPSQYEPCGLNQMYSLLYGTVPIVRATGGLDDTVIDLTAPTGNGIKFGPYEPQALQDALKRSLALFKEASTLREVRRRGMAADFSWERSARQYEALYRGVLHTNDLPKAKKAK